MGNLSEYLFKSFLLPKVVLLNEPGRILSKSVSRYGRERGKIRVHYGFEDTIVDLQKVSAKKLGRKKSEDMWYAIGKTFVMKHLTMSGSKKVPPMLREHILKFILSVFYYSGFSVVDNVKIDSDKMLLEVFGENNCICRKTGMGDIFAGVMSALMTYVYGKNIEAKKISCCCKDKFCRIISDTNVSKRFLVDENVIKTDSSYQKFNVIPKTLRHGSSFKDLIKFKKAKLDVDRYYLGEYALGLTEISFYEVICYFFTKNGMKEQYHKAVMDSSKKIFRNLAKAEKKEKLDFKFVAYVLTALGFGQIDVSKQRTGFRVLVTYPHNTKFGFNYLPDMICGGLSMHSKKTGKIEDLKFNKMSNVLRFSVVLE